MAQILLSKLRSMGVISDRGLQIGKLNDIMFNEKDGKIHSLVIKPSSKEALGDIPRDRRGNVLIPFGAVLSVRDFMVINERVLAVQKTKAPPKAERSSPAPPKVEQPSPAPPKAEQPSPAEK